MVRNKLPLVLALALTLPVLAGCLGGDEGGPIAGEVGECAPAPEEALAFDGQHPAAKAVRAASDAAPARAALSGLVQEEDLPVVQVGTDVPYPPFETLNEETGEFEGFDIDVMREIGSRAGFRPEFQARAFDTLIPAIQTGELDAAISAMSITEERSEQVDFSIPYYEANQSVSFRAGEAEECDSLEEMVGQGFIVGGQTGTVGAEIAIETFGQENVRTYQDYPLSMQALQRGDVDAVIMDEPAQREYVETHEGVEIGFEFSVGDVYGIAVQKGDDELLAQINLALEEMYQDGTLEELAEKWDL